MDFDSIRKLINTDVYRKTIAAVSQQSGIKIEEREDSTILNLGIQDFRASLLKEDVLYSVLHNHNDLLIRFSVKCLDEFKDDNEEEYPEGEEPDEDELPEVIEVGGILVITLITYMVELHFLLAKDDEGLSQYLKRRRIPYAAKHKKALKGIFQSL